MFDLGRTLLASTERDPDRLAVVDGDARFTYQEWFDAVGRTVDRVPLFAQVHDVRTKFLDVVVDPQDPERHGDSFAGRRDWSSHGLRHGRGGFHARGGQRHQEGRSRPDLAARLDGPAHQPGQLAADG